MPVTLDDDIFDELVRAYRARTGEEPAAAYLDVFRMEAEWQPMDQAERERRAAEKLKGATCLPSTTSAPRHVPASAWNDTPWSTTVTGATSRGLGSWEFEMNTRTEEPGPSIAPAADGNVGRIEARGRSPMDEGRRRKSSLNGSKPSAVTVRIDGFPSTTSVTLPP